MTVISSTSKSEASILSQSHPHYFPTVPSGNVSEVLGERVVMISTLSSVSGFGRLSWVGVDGSLTGLHMLDLGKIWFKTGNVHVGI